jgi:hypothetical protein
MTPVPKALSEVAPTLAELKKLPPGRKSQLLLARHHIFPHLLDEFARECTLVRDDSVTLQGLNVGIYADEKSAFSPLSREAVEVHWRGEIGLEKSDVHSFSHIETQSGQWLLLLGSRRTVPGLCLPNPMCNAIPAPLLNVHLDRVRSLCEACIGHLNQWLGPVVFKLLRGSNLALSGLCLPICGAGLFGCCPGLRWQRRRASVAIRVQSAVLPPPAAGMEKCGSIGMPGL